MAQPALLYYITDRSAFPGDELSRRISLLDKISEAANAGVNYIQLREKDLTGRDLESLAREALRLIGSAPTALLINSRADVARSVRAAGVHLTSQDISPSEVKAFWQCGAGALAREISLSEPVLSISCHSPQEVNQAATSGANLALFSPIYEKKSLTDMKPQGLAALRQACLASIPVLALGGITLQNAGECLKAGASGIAAIRLFQENEIATIVRELNRL